jgi:hypothetical protein
VAWLTSYAVPVRSRLAILVTLVACTDHGAASLMKIKDQVCACKTASCAEQAIKLVPQATIQSTHRTQTIARDMLDCLAKRQAAERPITDPDAEPGDEPGPTAAAPSPAAHPAAAPAAKATPTITAPPSAAKRPAVPTSPPPVARTPSAAPPAAKRPAAAPLPPIPAEPL